MEGKNEEIYKGKVFAIWSYETWITQIEQYS